MHSPYAYRFVKDVLRPGEYGYYAYQEIIRYLKDKEHHDYRFISLVKFTIRLVLFLGAKRIVSSSDHSRIAEVVSKSLSLPWVKRSRSKDFKFRDYDLFICDETSSSGRVPNQRTEMMQTAVENGIPVFVINPDSKERDFLDKPIERGLLLKGKKRIILIPREEMAYVAYDINLSLNPFSH